MNICIICIDQADSADNASVNYVKLLFNYLVKTTGTPMDKVNDKKYLKYHINVSYNLLTDPSFTTSVACIRIYSFIALQLNPLYMQLEWK